MLIRSRKLIEALEAQKAPKIPERIILEGPYEDFDRWNIPFDYWVVSIKNRKEQDLKSINFRSYDRAEEFALEESKNFFIEFVNEAKAPEEYRQ